MQRPSRLQDISLTIGNCYVEYDMNRYTLVFHEVKTSVFLSRKIKQQTIASRCGVKSLNILLNVPSGRLHRTDGLHSTAFTTMSFLPQRALPVTVRCEACETSGTSRIISGKPPSRNVFFSRARELNPKCERRVKLLIPSGGGKGMDNMRNVKSLQVRTAKAVKAYLCYTAAPPKWKPGRRSVPEPDEVKVSGPVL